MTTALPDYYFRIRENGAIVFRLDTENRNRRIEMDQIAVVNLRKGEIKPHGDTVLSGLPFHCWPYRQDDPKGRGHQYRRGFCKRAPGRS